MARIGGANAGDVIILIGGDGSHLGQSPGCAIASAVPKALRQRSI
jgi:hypothetical protein